MSVSPEDAGTGTKNPDRQALKAGISGFVGTTVEWFDFFIYGTASALVFGDVFFPEASPAIGTLAAFATFWVGFLARPLGGLIFGHFGDRVGRKRALVVTLLMMGFATMGVGVLPTYAQIGITAPILLILLRMVQGVAMGGEWGGAVLISTEHASRGKKLIYGAFAQQGAPVGNLCATVAFMVIATLSDGALHAWGWRIPFLISALLVLVGLFIRLRLEESPEMRKVMQGNKAVRVPVKDVLRKHSKIVVLCVGATVAGVTLSYVKTTFALSWATTDLDFSESQFLLVILVALIVQVVLQPFGAVLAERMDLRRAILWMLLPEIVLLPVMFLLISTGSTALAMLGMAVTTIPTSLYYAALAGIIAQVFPVELRYTGMSISYQLCSTLFAGTAPLIGQFLLTTTNSIWPVVGMGIFYIVLSLASVTALIRQDAWRNRHGASDGKAGGSASSAGGDTPAVVDPAGSAAEDVECDPVAADRPAATVGR